MCRAAPPPIRKRASGSTLARSPARAFVALLLLAATLVLLGFYRGAGQLAHHLAPRSQALRRADASPSPEHGASAAGLLCLPDGIPRTLLVEVPFTVGDVPSLELSVGLWERTWPCQTPPAAGLHSRPDLVFAFNSNISEPRYAAARARVRRLMRRPVLLECFGDVRLESAYLTGFDDTYDKQRLDANWTLGPNNIFWHFLERAADDGYRYMMQLEADTLPLRPRWLDKLACIATHGRHWVVGSPFLAQCAYDTHTRHCAELGTDIKFHINGNALYAAGDAQFRRYWRLARAARTSAWGPLETWPFDLALHLYARQLPDAMQRRLSSRFKYDGFVLNFGTEALPEPVSTVDKLRKASPAAYLLHSSWAMGLLRRQGAAAFRQLGLAPPADLANSTTTPTTATTTLTTAATMATLPLPASSAAAAAVTDGRDGTNASTTDDEGEATAPLLRLARKRADSRGHLMLTFVTSTYDTLAINFVMHLRRLRLDHYLLVTFDADQQARLVARGEESYLHELHQLKSGGSDVFASKDFFLINSARYDVLVALLRGGVHIFAVDLDAALLRDPFPFVAAQPFDLMLQSDARDAASMQETSPYLLRDRLLRPNLTAVTYVNGGVFFARGSAAVARLFEDAWSLVSQDLGTLNEQDCLNRMLLASHLRWAPLPPLLFPNGYVFFRRPLPRAMQPSGGPVLIHSNWINGIVAKRYQLREALVWAPDLHEMAGTGRGGLGAAGNGVGRGGNATGAAVGAGASEEGEGAAGALASSLAPPPSPSAHGLRDDDDDGRLYLAYHVGESEEERSVAGQTAALESALAIARLSNRTLVLPPFYALLPRRDRNPAAEAAEASEASAAAGYGSAAPWTELEAAVRGLEEGEVARKMREEAEAAAQVSVSDPNAAPRVLPWLSQDQWSEPGVRCFTYFFEYAPFERLFPEHREASLLRRRWGGRDGAPGGIPLPREVPPGDAAHGEVVLSRWLRGLRTVPLLHLHGLHRHHVRLKDDRQHAAFERQLASGLRPAPELRTISAHITSMLRAYASGHGGGHHHGHGGRRGDGGGADGGHGGGEQRGHSRRSGARRGGGRDGGGAGAHAAAAFNCLHVRRHDVGSEAAVRAAAGGLNLQVTTLIVSEDDELVGTAADASFAGGAGQDDGGGSLPAAVRRVLPRAVRLGDFYPYWDAVEVHDAGSGARTLAYDFLQQLVCADAQRVHGNATADFVRAICRWRLGGLFQHTFQHALGAAAAAQGGSVGSAAGSGAVGRAGDDICATLSATEAALRRSLFSSAASRRGVASSTRGVPGVASTALSTAATVASIG